MLDNLAVKIQKAFNLKSATGAKFLIIPLFTEIPVVFSWLILSDDIEMQIASPNGHLCHIRRPLRDLIGGQLGTH